MTTTMAEVIKGAKRRYSTLDAMRSLAAIFVVSRHIGPYQPRFSYLAVDLFFVLSGFVLAMANDSRFRNGLSARAFLLARVVRLYPLYLLGIVIAIVAEMVAHECHLTPGQLLLSAVQEMLGVPGITSPRTPYPFSLDRPLWSIFFEFWVANLFYAVFWKHMQGRVLTVLIFVCAVILLVVEIRGLPMDLGSEWSTFLLGFPRVCFSFFAGVALARVHRVNAAKMAPPSWAMLLALAISFAVPLRGTPARFYDLFCLFAVFPAFIHWGASAVERRPKLGEGLGEMSYCLYAIHYPLAKLAVFACLTSPLALSVMFRGRWGPVLGEIGFMLAIVPISYAVNTVMTYRPDRS